MARLEDLLVWTAKSAEYNSSLGTNGYFDGNETRFLSALNSFLEDPYYSFYEDHIIFSDSTNETLASRLNLWQVNVPDTRSKVDGMLDLR